MTIFKRKPIDQLKTFAPDIEITPTEPLLPLLRVQPATIVDVDAGLEHCQEKFDRRMMWSDPAQPEEFESFVDSSKRLLAQAAFNDTQLSMYQKRRLDDLQVKSTARERIRTPGSGLEFTKEQADSTEISLPPSSTSSLEVPERAPSPRVPGSGPSDPEPQAGPPKHQTREY